MDDIVVWRGRASARRCTGQICSGQVSIVVMRKTARQYDNPNDEVIAPLVHQMYSKKAVAGKGDHKTLVWHFNGSAQSQGSCLGEARQCGLRSPSPSLTPILAIALVVAVLMATHHTALPDLALPTCRPRRIWPLERQLQADTARSVPWPRCRATSRVSR